MCVPVCVYAVNIPGRFLAVISGIDSVQLPALNTDALDQQRPWQNLSSSYSKQHREL